MSRGGYVSGFGLQDYIYMCYVEDIGMYREEDLCGVISVVMIVRFCSDRVKTEILLILLSLWGAVQNKLLNLRMERLYRLS